MYNGLKFDLRDNDHLFLKYSHLSFSGPSEQVSVTYSYFDSLRVWCHPNQLNVLQKQKLYLLTLILHLNRLFTL